MGATPQHLSVDDLFAPLPDFPMLGGSGPFVINLSSSSVPISLPNNGIAVAPNTRAYQIRCVEDRSVRYRLRLGPFVTEAQANAVLLVVRDSYPAALTATAISSDLEAFADIQFQSVSEEVAVPVPAAAPVPVSQVQPSAQTEARAQPELLTAELSFSPPPVAAAAIDPPTAVAPPILTLSTVEYTPPTITTAKPVGDASAGGLTLLPELFTIDVLADPAPAAAPSPPRPKALKRSLIESLTALGFPPTNTSQQVPVRLTRGAPKSVPPVLNPAPSPGTVTAAKTAASPAMKQAAAGTLLPGKPLMAPKPPMESKPLAASTPLVAPKPLAPSKPVVAPKPLVPSKPMVAPKPLVESKPPVASKPLPASKPLMAPKAAVPSSLAKAPARPAAASWPTAAELDKRPLSLESTQTLRTLTPSELESATQLRWFVVELATSDRAFDPDAVPNLDIFAAYRLYSVETTNQGAVKHTLRLGFFSEAIAAQAVADYLASHYDKPAVARVSIAERERFCEQGIEARKIVEATGRHAVIEITDERYVREPRALS